MNKGIALALSALLPFLAARSAEASGCRVVDGVVADLAPGPFMPGGTTVTMKKTYTAEFRWNPLDREAIGWMRIADENGRELGFVPAGHEAVRCGENH